ncbi:MAG: 4-hydroxy-tetrahydrodipicolinate reductase [Proteobacteria bacterium]|nr:4-hydroxy-tetrahydrodipicolinate reductase [Pseudomonadota bacterium]
MIRVLLLGALGKMGRQIAISAKQYDDIVITKMVDKIDKRDNNDFSEITGISGYDLKILDDTDKKLFTDVDCVVEFTQHEATVGHVVRAKQYGIPYVIGTTGFSENERKIISDAAGKMPVFISSNMSRGINVINLLLDRLVANFSEYDVELWELHHRDKRDAPSGTAMMLAETIKNAFQGEKRVVLGRSGVDSKRKKNEISVSSIRGGDIFGEHHILFAGDGENIEIVHRATNRAVFANGALDAVRFIIKKQTGMFGFKKLLKD